MKKGNLKENRGLRWTPYRQLVISFKRAIEMIRGESSAPSELQFSREELPNTFLTYDEPQVTNAQLIEMERHRAEAIQLVREHNRHV